MNDDAREAMGAPPAPPASGRADLGSESHGPAQGKTPDVVVLDGVSRRYRAKGRADMVDALVSVSMRIPRGAVAAIRGESGSGKSTLLHLIGGLDRPDHGRVIVNGMDLAKQSEGDLAAFRARTIGFVFQAYFLVPTLSALENVEFAMDAGGLPRRERRPRAEELLAAVGLGKRMHHRPAQLSGGEQQRVGIARALANRPTLVLADEPTGNLDKRSRNEVLDLLLRTARTADTTVVIVTHDSHVADRCEIIYRLRDGRLSRKG
ncbi:MAG: ABC transporter ATP-binding protein [Thermoplasmatota archaeon]